VQDVLAEMRSRGRDPCMISGDLNAEKRELGVVEELTVAGCAEWSEGPACITANTKRPRGIDHVWLSPEMQARL
jgi:hypothetical protein